MNRDWLPYEDDDWGIFYNSSPLITLYPFNNIVSSPVSRVPVVQVVRGFQHFLQKSCACGDCEYIMNKVNESINRVLPKFTREGALAEDTQLVIFRPQKTELSGIGVRTADDSGVIILVNPSQEKAGFNFSISQELFNGSKYVLKFALSGEKREKTLIASKEEVENLLKSVEFSAKIVVVLSFEPIVNVLDRARAGAEVNPIFIGDKLYPVELEFAPADNYVSISPLLQQIYTGLADYLERYCITELGFAGKKCELIDFLIFIKKSSDIFIKKVEKESLVKTLEIFFSDKRKIEAFSKVCRDLNREGLYLKWMVSIIKVILEKLSFDCFGFYEEILDNRENQEIAGFCAFLEGLACIGEYFRLGGAQSLEYFYVNEYKKQQAQIALGQSVNFLGKGIVKEIKIIQKYFTEKNTIPREHFSEKAVIPRPKQARFLEEDNTGKIEQFRAEVNISGQVIQDAIAVMKCEKYYAGFNMYWDKGGFINYQDLSEALGKSCIFCFSVNLAQVSFEDIKMRKILYSYIKNFLSRYLKNEIYIVYAKLGTVESEQGLLFILGKWLAQLSNAGEKIYPIQSLTQAVLPEDIIIDVILDSPEIYIDLSENKEETGVEKLQKIFNEVCFPKRIEYEFIREFFFKLGELRAKLGFGVFTSLRKLSSKLIVFFAGLPENKFKDICFGDLDLEENVICLPVRVDE
ncbi:MAG: hypothetical protein ABIH08_07635, partial [Candidatus Omnitrophota bacterium]